MRDCVAISTRLHIFRRGKDRKMRRSNRGRLVSALRNPRPDALLDPLEVRLLFATFIVNNTADGGPGSLRNAIMMANSSGGPDAIEFRIGTGLRTIAALGALP